MWLVPSPSLKQMANNVDTSRECSTFIMTFGEALLKLNEKHVIVKNVYSETCVIMN